MLQNNNVISLELNTLKSPTPLLCHDYNKQTKSKFEDESKTNRFFMYV